MLTPEAELFYRRLMSCVDDYGRFHGNPSQLLAACYPLQLDRISRDEVVIWLAECCALTTPTGMSAHKLTDGRKLPQLAALVEHYEVDGKSYIQINKFGQRERTGSKFPPPPAVICPQDAADIGSSRLARAHSKSESKAYTKSESNAESDAGADARVSVNHVLDDFSQFLEICHAAELPASEVDLDEARIQWKRLDFQQKIDAVQGLRQRIAAGELDDPAYRPLPQNYLEKKLWQRPVRQRGAHEASKVYDKRNETVGLSKVFAKVNTK